MSRSWRTFGFAAGLVVLFVGVFLRWAGTSKRGGNFSALAASKHCVLTLLISQPDPLDGGAFQVTDKDIEQRFRHYLMQLWDDMPELSRLRSGQILVRLRVDAEDTKQIVVVCDHPFDNVPQRWLGKSPMAHAFAYSTGETGLISPKEFAGLDISNFVDVSTVVKPTKVEPDGAANGSQPIRSETSRTRSTAGSRR